MKDLKSFIDQKTVNEILEINNKGCQDVPFEMVEGRLLDNYLISQINHPAQYASSKRTKPRKYLILLEKLVNEWTSTTLLIQTDNDQTFDRYENLFYDRQIAAEEY